MNQNNEEHDDDPGTLATSPMVKAEDVSLLSTSLLGLAPPAPVLPTPAPPALSTSSAPSSVPAPSSAASSVPPALAPAAAKAVELPIEISADDVRAIDVPLATTPQGGFITRHPPASMPSLDGVSFDELGAPPRTTTPASSPASTKPPILAEKYKLERELARGAMGRVYLATQLGLNRKVAVKVMSPKLDDEDFRRRFTLEATGLANLSHRNIVTVYDHGESKRGLLYLVLEYLKGHTLAQVITKDGPLPVSRTLAVTAQVLRGLRAAHKKGLVHRDLKPSNIFLVRDEEGEDEVKILDFGIAKVFSSVEVAPDATRDGMLLGTPAFMSPEQIEGGRLGPWTDLYALGCVVFNLLSGRVPFPGRNDVEILTGHLKVPAPRLRTMPGCEQLPVGLENFVAKLLEKKIEDRFADADTALEALRTLTAELLSSDAALRAAVSPEFVASLASSGSLGSLSSSGSTGASRPGTIDPALARIADGSSAELARPLLEDSGKLLATPTAPTGIPQHALDLPAPAPKSLPRAALVGAVAAALVVVAGWWFTRGHSSITIESIPAGLELISADGRVLGKSPVVLDTDEKSLLVRGRIGDALSDVRTLTVFDGRVVADFSDWSRTLGDAATAEATLPTPAPPDAVEEAEADDEPANTTASTTANVKAAPSSKRRPPPRVVARATAPAPTTTAPTTTTTPAPATPPAPTRPSIGLLDDKAHVGALDNKPGIGLLDESPAVAPID